MDYKKKISKFTPFDKVLEGLEQEDLIDQDTTMKIIKVYSVKKNHKMFLLERIITNEKDHLRYIDEIHKYESLSAEGLLNIEKWTYDMIIDQNMNKHYKFILVFDTYVQNLRQYLDTVSAKKLQLLKEDVIYVFRIIVQALAHMQTTQLIHFNPVCMNCIVLCSDTNVKFNAIPLLITNHSLEKAKIENNYYLAPDHQKGSLYQNAVYSFGLIFIQFFLMRNINNLNERPDIVRQCLKDIQTKYGEVYKQYLEGMIESDCQKRIKLSELAQTLQTYEPVLVNHNNYVAKVTFSEQFEFFRKSYEFTGHEQIRTIAYAIPWTRQVLLSNLFNIKTYFLELLELQINQIISDKSVSVIAEQFRVFILGGVNSKYVYELDDEVPTIKQRAIFPSCQQNRWGFGYTIYQNSIYICSGYQDQIICNSFYKLDLNTFQWHQLPNCNKQCEGGTLVVFNDHIFKFGGNDANGKSINIIEKFEHTQWRTISYRQPNYNLPSNSLAIQINPTQIFILGGQMDKQDNTKVLSMNIDLYAHIIDTGEDFIYVEFTLFNEQWDYGNFGLVEQIQISNNQLFMLHRKSEKYQYMTTFDPIDGFTEIRKIHI